MGIIVKKFSPSSFFSFKATFPTTSSLNITSLEITIQHVWGLYTWYLLDMQSSYPTNLPLVDIGSILPSIHLTTWMYAK